MADGIAARLNSVAEDAADARSVDAVFLHPGGPVVARPGRRPGPGLTVTVGGTPEAASVAPGGGIITDTTGGGSYRFVLPATVSKDLATRPGSGTSRIDLVIARIRNTDIHPTDGGLDVIVEVVTGTAAASPVAPTVPAAALQLATLTIPNTGTITVAGAPPRTAAAGGILIVTGTTQRDAISPVWDGIKVYREDTDTFESRVAGAWTPDGPPDTGWSNLTGFNTFWPVVSGQTPRVRMIGDQVSIHGSMTRDTAAAAAGGVASDTGIVLATQYRPSKAIHDTVVVWDTPGLLIYILVETDGTISLRNMGTVALAVGKRVDINLAYLVG